MNLPPPRSPPPKPLENQREGQRIAKLLARAGIASRREIERMIAEGRVALNGQVLETPATVLPSLRGVTVDGQPVREAAPARLFRYHKPAGLLTAERDPKGRPTIYDRLPAGLPRLMPVGRLDLNTEGLLLLTTDGELKRQLELPSTGVERIYRARTFGEISQEQLEELIHGIEIDGIRYGQIDANLERRTGRNQWIELRLKEGKNREVRRVLEHLGLQVSRLIRTAYGPFPLADLPPGAVDEVRQHDLVVFRGALRGGREAPSPPGGQAREERREAPALPRSRPHPERRPSPDPRKARTPGPEPRPQREERPAKFERRQRPEREDRETLHHRPRRESSRPERPKAGQLQQRPAPATKVDSDTKPARKKRGEGWAKPKIRTGPGKPSSRPTPRGGGGGKRGPTRGRPPSGRK